MKAGNYLLIVMSALVITVAGLSILLLSMRDHSDTANKENSQSTNGNIQITITNNIQNNINGTDQVEVETSITNDISADAANSIENNIQNKVAGNGDAKLSNTIDNKLKGQNTTTLNNTLDNQLNGNGTHSIENKMNNSLGDKAKADINNSTTNGTVESENDNGQNDNDGQEDGTVELPEVVWGIDSASETTSEFIACVRENFGEPVIFGRYLGDKEGVSNGLTEEQVRLIQEQGGYILPIFNQFENATGFDNGVAEAEEAIRLAQEIGIPEGVAIFADIEPEYPVDSAFISGWFETISASPYRSGIYGIFDPDRALTAAYEEASENNTALLEENVIWTASPNIGITTKDEAPEYNPDAPEGSLVLGWQYGIDAETCNIDTNLFDREIVEVLWAP